MQFYRDNRISKHSHQSRLACASKGYTCNRVSTVRSVIYIFALSLFLSLSLSLSLSLLIAGTRSVRQDRSEKMIANSMIKRRSRSTCFPHLRSFIVINASCVALRETVASSTDFIYFRRTRYSFRSLQRDLA